MDEIFYLFNHFKVISKNKNQIESRLANLRDAYLKGSPFNLEVKEIDDETYSLEIFNDTPITQLIIPDLREIKLIKKGEIEL